MHYGQMSQSFKTQLTKYDLVKHFLLTYIFSLVFKSKLMRQTPLLSENDTYPNVLD